MRTHLVVPCSIATAFLLAASPAVAQVSAGGNPCSDVALGVALDDWGGTLVVGAAFDNRVLEWEAGHAHYGDLGLARLLPDGTPDDAFGEAGNVVIDVGDFDELSEVAAFGPWVYAAGVTARTSGDRRGNRDVVLLRVDPLGQADAGFGAHGVAVLDLGADEEVSALAIDPRGGAWIAGTISSASGSDGFVARITPQGVLDPEVGSGGIVRFDSGSAADRFLSLQIHGDVLHVGGVTTVDGQAAALALGLDLSGVPLSNYGVSGVSIVPVGEALGDSVSFHGASGSTAVTLTHAAGTEVHAVTALFGASGELLGAPTEVSLPGGASVTAGGLWWAGSLYLSGAIYDTSSTVGDAFLARASDGALDPDFAEQGLSREHLALEYAAYIDLAMSFDGVTAVGWEFSEAELTLGDSDALVARYTEAGLLDSSFGKEGVVLHDFRGGALVCGPASFLAE
ncbi:MAG: hypothetical protein RL685_913 [Pseudomonadota bacterium]|jgi:uncharacterized delta-60 repeat protein